MVPLVAVAWYRVPLTHGRRPNSMKNTEGSGAAKGGEKPPMRLNRIRYQIADIIIL